MEDGLGDLVRRFLIVSVTGLVAALGHIHPDFTIGNEAILESLTGGPSGPDDALDTLAFEVILEHVPSQLMGELESLNQPLLFERRKLPLASQLGAFRQTDEGFVKALQTLVPADIGVGRHGVKVGGKNEEGKMKNAEWGMKVASGGSFQRRERSADGL
jgi:hypothetical protein